MALLLVFSLFTAFPFVWMVISALKTKTELMDMSKFFPTECQWNNFYEVIFNSPLLKYVWNSFFVSVVTLVIQLVTAAMIAYAIVFMKFKGRKVLFAVIMGTYMLPTAATYIPGYIILADMNLLDTFTGLIISNCVSIFGIFLLRQAFMQMPAGAVEAARIDGASNWKILWEIVFPMTKSSFITFGLMNFITSYNSYMWPSLITDSEDKYMVSQGLRKFFIEGGAYGTTQVMYYNKAAFEAAGIDAKSISTWQDLAAAAEKMTSKDGSFVGWEPMWGYENLIDAALSNGASLISEDGKTVMINSDEWVEVWESFRKWIHDDKIMKVNSGGQGWEYWYVTIDDVIQNKAGGYTGSSGDQADLDFDIVAAMEQPGFNDNPSAPTADALQLVMLEGSSEETKQGVYEFMKYFTTPKNQAKWSMATGYVAVRYSTKEVEEFKKYTEEHPQALVPMAQAAHGTPALIDPTGGKILDALSIAADKVELENIPAKEALDEAQKTAQEALDNTRK